MRTAFLYSFIANILLSITTWYIGPDRVAIHFGPGGQPDSWVSSGTNRLIMTGFHVLMFVLFFYSAKLVAVCPASFISLPNKHYWLKPENRPAMICKLNGHMYSLGTATFVFMFLVGVLALEANLSQPVRFREELFWWPFGLYMAYVVYWTVKILFVFRVPKPTADFADKSDFTDN